ASLDASSATRVRPFAIRSPRSSIFVDVPLAFHMTAPPEQLVRILQGFASLQPPRTITFPSSLPWRQVHDFVLNFILLNEHFRDYPPSEQYQSTFWKWAIARLEEFACAEACAGTNVPILRMMRLMNEYIIAISHSYHVPFRMSLNISPYVIVNSRRGDTVGTAPPARSFVTYIWKAGESENSAVYPGYASATLMEARTTIESGTTGLRTWSASLILAQHIISHPALVQHKCVLELGCGIGFLGVVAASVQQQLGDASDAPSTLWLTDVNDTVLQKCQENLQLPCNQSFCHPNLKFEQLDWSDALAAASRPALQAFFQEVKPHIVLGADVVFDPSIIPALVNTLHLALQSGVDDEDSTPVAYLALTVRNGDTYSEFIQVAGEL
ncbi:Protein-lysine N-methyltransferase EEF2KMT, partial [Grifola frondosa]